MRTLIAAVSLAVAPVIAPALAVSLMTVPAPAAYAQDSVPGSAAEALAAAEALELDGDFADAESAYRAVVETFPEAPEAGRALLRLGSLAEAAGRTDDAVGFYERAREWDGVRAEAAARLLVLQGGDPDADPADRTRRRILTAVSLLLSGDEATRTRGWSILERLPTVRTAEVLLELIEGNASFELQSGVAPLLADELEDAAETAPWGEVRHLFLQVANMEDDVLRTMILEGRPDATTADALADMARLARESPHADVRAWAMRNAGYIRVLRSLPPGEVDVVGLVVELTDDPSGDVRSAALRSVKDLLQARADHGRTPLTPAEAARLLDVTRGPALARHSLWSFDDEVAELLLRAPREDAVAWLQEELSVEALGRESDNWWSPNHLSTVIRTLGPDFTETFWPLLARPGVPPSFITEFLRWGPSLDPELLPPLLEWDDEEVRESARERLLHVISVQKPEPWMLDTALRAATADDGDEWWETLAQVNGAGAARLLAACAGNPDADVPPAVLEMWVVRTYVRVEPQEWPAMYPEHWLDHDAADVRAECIGALSVRTERRGRLSDADMAAFRRVFHERHEDDPVVVSALAGVIRDSAPRDDRDAVATPEQALELVRLHLEALPRVARDSATWSTQGEGQLQQAGHAIEAALQTGVGAEQLGRLVPELAAVVTLPGFQPSFVFPASGAHPDHRLPVVLWLARPAPDDAAARAAVGRLVEAAADDTREDLRLALPRLLARLQPEGWRSTLAAWAESPATVTSHVSQGLAMAWLHHADPAAGREAAQQALSGRKDLNAPWGALPADAILLHILQAGGPWDGALDGILEVTDTHGVSRFAWRDVEDADRHHRDQLDNNPLTRSVLGWVGLPPIADAGGIQAFATWFLEWASVDQARRLLRAPEWPSRWNPDRRGLIELFLDMHGMEAIAPVLHDAPLPVLLAAIQALGQTLDLEAARMLLPLLQDERDHVRARVQEALQTIREYHEAHREWAVWVARAEAAAALGERDEDAAVRLLGQLRGDDPAKAAAAARGLAALGAREALPDLIALLDHEDAAVRAAVEAAIEHLTALEPAAGEEGSDGR